MATKKKAAPKKTTKSAGKAKVKDLEVKKATKVKGGVARGGGLSPIDPDGPIGL